MTKLEKLRDQEAENYSLQQWPKQDYEYEGTHVAEGEYPSHYRHSVYKAVQAGWDARDAIAKEREAKLVDLICELENYLQWNTDNLVGDDLIGDQRLTKRFNQVINNIHVALADHKRMMEGE